MSEDLSKELWNGYLVKNPILYAYLRFVDGLSIIHKPKQGGEIKTPLKILLCHTGHLGDVIMATSVLPIIKKHWPKVKIGFLIGSWSKPVLDGHPLVDEFHFFDHWKLNRNKTGRWIQHWETYRNALKEISKFKYDLVMDLYGYYPNAIKLVTKAKIPKRIGFISGGYGPLLTHPNSWIGSDDHIADSFRLLLSNVFLPDSLIETMQPNIPDRWQQANSIYSNDYLVFHPGSGNKGKDWPIENWRELLRLLSNNVVILTGSGQRDEILCQQIAKKMNQVKNYCSKLNWESFVATIAGARAIVSVDSVSGHLASAVSTPGVIVSQHSSGKRWKPMSDKIYWLAGSPKSPVLVNTVFRQVNLLL